MNLGQLALLLAEIVGLSVLFLGCFRLRAVLGLVPVYTMLGVVFYTCNLLAAGVYVKLLPNLIVSPGTVAFFPAIIFVVLCVYITEDADEARKLIYGLLITDVFVVALGWLTAMHLQLPGALNDYHLSPALFTAGPRVSTVSVIALFADTVVIILLYELVSRFTRLLFLRIFVSTALVLVLDTLIFITGAYVENPQYVTFLVSAIVGKTLAAVVYAVLFTIYLQYIDTVQVGPWRSLGPTFRTLTYRQKFELLQQRSARDPLTGIYNRGFFDEIFPTLTATALRIKTPLAVLMADIDHFKLVNDEHGHLVGDTVLKAVAAALSSIFRSSDYVCRYGGEEFVVLLPNTDLVNATELAIKVQSRIAEASAAVGPAVTVTIGVACFPSEAQTPDALLALVDRRLYEGKAAGRNRVVSATPMPT
jgi:diguanylate cyclase (GGDEF)-like protein